MSLSCKLSFSNYGKQIDFTRLELIAEKISDGIHSTPSYTENGEYYFINGNNLINGSVVINSKTKQVDQEEHKKHAKTLNNKTILLSINGTIGNVALYNNEKILLGKSACFINLKQSINHEFIYYVLNSPSIKKYFLSELTGTTIKNLSLATIKKTKIYLPDEKEQQKIASFLTSVDSKISQLTEKHRLLKEYKKGVMQQIFSQQLRFKDKDGKAFPEWESMNLDDVLLLQSDSLKMKDNESYELITVKRRFGGITSRGNYLGKDVLVKNQFTIHEDEFVISKRQIVHGACGLVPKELEGAIVSNEYNVFRPVADKLDLDYFNRFSTTPYMRRSYFINSDGVHIEKLLFKTQSWLKTKVDLPCLKEQQKIAQFLQSIDKKIDVVAQQVEQTKQFKKGLLQQMFV